MAYDSPTAIEDMLASMFDPLIVAPGGWAEDLPAWLRHMIEMERMVVVMRASKENKRPEMATDAEAMVYIMSASHIGPMPYQWTNIYLWLGKQVLAKRMPDIIGENAPKKLSADEQRMLDDLKRWIWQRRLRARGLRKGPG
jgi:hypothetical protein